MTSTQEKFQDYKGYESPPYTVLEKNGPIEIRRYEAVLIAEVEVKGDRAKAINEGFRILAGYIFGGNNVKQKIAMTTPVVQYKVNDNNPITSLSNKTSTDSDWKVCFTMPAQYALDTLPLPYDQRIQFKKTKPIKKIVIRFAGLITEKNLDQHVAMLKDYINKHSLNVTDATMQYSFYDAPWTLPFLRRNEISYFLQDN